MSSPQLLLHPQPAIALLLTHDLAVLRLMVGRQPTGLIQISHQSAGLLP